EAEKFIFDTKRRKRATKGEAEAHTKEEALKNIREAIELYLEPVDDDLRFNPDAQVLEIAI
ncbi:MAG: hypothetical protein Q7J76_02670, partial [Candidatus Brocadiaceae bacterium]|nr:hypothetical protein [Candidatus Brocadiaceae bacterium]